MDSKYKFLLPYFITAAITIVVATYVSIVKDAPTTYIIPFIIGALSLVIVLITMFLSEPNKFLLSIGIGLVSILTIIVLMALLEREQHNWENAARQADMKRQQEVDTQKERQIPGEPMPSGRLENAEIKPCKDFNVLIKEGVTNQNDLIRLLGNANKEEPNPDGTQVWKYKERSSHDIKVFIIKFNKDTTVRDCRGGLYSLRE